MQHSILVVDDEPGIRDTLRGVLEDEGFAVETAATGEACLKSVASQNFACILLDIWLGKGIDGLETLPGFLQHLLRRADRLLSGRRRSP